MIKKKHITLILSVLLTLSTGYIIFLKQELSTKTEDTLDARIEALEYKKAAHQEARKAEEAAAHAMMAQEAAKKAEKMAQLALEEAKIQTILAKKLSNK